MGSLTCGQSNGRALLRSVPSSGRLIKPKKQLVMDHAQDLKKCFLDGGLIRDCLSIVGSLDKKLMGTLVRAASAK